MPIASNTRLGAIKVGNNLSIDASGVLSASGGGGGDVPSDKIPTEILNLSKETSHTKGLVLAHDGVPLSPQDIAYFSYIFEATISDITSSVSNSDFLSNNADLIKSIVGLEKYNELVSANSLPFTIFNTEQLQMSYIHFTITNEPNTDLIVPVLGIGQSQDFGSSTSKDKYSIDIGLSSLKLNRVLNFYEIPKDVYIFDENCTATSFSSENIDIDKLINADIISIYFSNYEEPIKVQLYKNSGTEIDNIIIMCNFGCVIQCFNSSQTNDFGQYGSRTCNIAFFIQKSEEGQYLMYSANTGGSAFFLEEDYKIRNVDLWRGFKADNERYPISPGEIKEITYQWSGSIPANQGQYISITTLPSNAIIQSFQIVADVISAQPYLLDNNWYVYVFNTTTSEINDLSIIIKYYEV